MFDTTCLSTTAYQLSKSIDLNKCNLIITPDIKDAETLFEDLIFFKADKRILLLPDSETLDYEEITANNEISAKRINALASFYNGPATLITTVKNSEWKSPHPKNYTEIKIMLYDDCYDLTAKLLQLGYQEASLTEHSGQFTAHGKTVDFFPANTSYGIRIELNHQEVIGIRTFDPISQLSKNKLNKCRVLPVSENNLEKTHSVLELFEEIKTPGKIYNIQQDKSYSNNTDIRQLCLSGYKSDEHPLPNIVKKLLERDFAIIFVCLTELRIERIKNILGVYQNHKKIAYEKGKLSSGFKLKDKKIIYIAEQEIFPERSNRESKKTEVTNLKRLLSTLSSLIPDDYVVHEDYGRGIYRGLKTITVAEKTDEFIQIDYADSKLFLPVQKIGRLQKYTVPDDKEPIIDKLSSKKWQQVKTKVRKSVQVIAGELLKLYAAREQSQGWQCLPQTNLDQEFADYFPFNETEDQLQAIQDIYQDLSSGRPMDRLICGDVGFGKTEVAMRAAFKCAMEGKQVAILAPTTLLVDQHYENFKKRFHPFPLKIAALSRFYPASENKKNILDLAEGKIDIIIGTHKLIQRNVKFKDLGLLIVDEEQRFGVKQKEFLKQYKNNVHVLTLSATPIPRTMYSSLINIRDISTISTPPTDRRAIKTYIGIKNEQLIKEAITKELNRQGQIYFLHNRIKDIELVTTDLRELLPEARIEFAHGQMEEKQLENIMHRFIRHGFDILVTTTIIENGIDIANANTLIIDQANAFGLAQLYQLRGRVGRSNRQAYAHFLIPGFKKITPEAYQRLKALSAIDDLGQGFHLALRDLEIRGAGNVLGAEQSGNIFEIGYGLYNKLLQHAINYLKDIPDENIIDPEVKIPLPAYIPEDYLPNPSERLILYQRLASAISQAELSALQAETIDRFGSVPDELANYFLLIQTRIVLREYGIEALEVRKEKLILRPGENHKLDIKKIIELCSTEPAVYKISAKNIITIKTENQNAEKSFYEFIEKTKTTYEISDHQLIQGGS